MLPRSKYITIFSKTSRGPPRSLRKRLLYDFTFTRELRITTIFSSSYFQVFHLDFSLFLNIFVKIFLNLWTFAILRFLNFGMFRFWDCRIFENFLFSICRVQNLKWSNVERPTFRNFKITSVKIAKDEKFDYFIYEFIIYYYFFKLLEHSRYLIIFPNYKIFRNFLNW